MSALDSADATWIPDLGVAVVSADPGELSVLQTTEEGRGSILVVEPELVHRIRPLGSADYLSGYRDGVSDLSGRLGGQAAGTAVGATATESFADTPQVTWGLQATGAAASSRSGSGIRVAVLDTGFDLTHPDFAGRTIQSQSFITGEAVQDGRRARDSLRRHVVRPRAQRRHPTVRLCAQRRHLRGQGAEQLRFRL